MSPRRASVFALASVLGLGCFLYPDRGSRSVMVQAGNAVEVFDHYNVHFSGVQNDSRCPMDATCSSPGDATLHFTVRNTEFNHPGNQGINLHTNSEPRSGDSEGINVRVDSLLPRRQSTQPINPLEYRAYVTVSGR
jgi:hypothetical protein